MKYLKYFENSEGALKFKMRETLFGEIDNILEDLKDDYVDYQLSWDFMNRSRLTIRLKKKNNKWSDDDLIPFHSIKDTMDHLVNFLKSEKFTLLDNEWVVCDYKNIDGLRVTTGFKYKNLPNDLYFLTLKFDLNY